MTLARFSKKVTPEFINKIKELSQVVNFEPYAVNSVSLITANAVLKRQEIIKTWKLS